MSLIIFIGLLLISTSQAANGLHTAPISGFARVFLSNQPIPFANITILETGQQIKTDREGRFGPFAYPIGKPVTLLFSKSGYKTIQSGTFIVPAQGLTGRYHQISFQVPSNLVYHLLKAALGTQEDLNSCHLATTVTAFHKTLDDVPQGEPGATLTLTPNVKQAAFYFDLFKKGPFKGLTYPFATGLTQTSEDGGVLFANLPPRDAPYTITAKKSGVVFNQVRFICRKGAFINISPPQGPMIQA